VQIKLEGTIFSGRGEGKKFVALPWVQSQIKEHLCFKPYLGTLNLRLNVENQKKRTYLDNADGFLIKPEKGFLPGKLFLAQTGGVCCAVILPIILNYPADVLEIVAEHGLREKLKLKDGDCVAVAITV
jgi:riboflavin kinase, archaea type